MEKAAQLRQTIGDQVNAAKDLKKAAQVRQTIGDQVKAEKDLKTAAQLHQTIGDQAEAEKDLETASQLRRTAVHMLSKGDSDEANLAAVQKHNQDLHNSMRQLMNDDDDDDLSDGPGEQKVGLMQQGTGDSYPIDAYIAAQKVNA